ncbi:MAG TPA: hypothetical protein VMU11_04435, partial [Verrucomicrobiae bacterium]|nr:hypothetical protein [Verrucomicrobiae bacterium]
MKKLFFAFVSIGLCCFFAGPALATSGACSSHGGVDCAAGADYDGSVICYDGWTGSSVAYANMVECGGSSQGGADYSFDNSSGSGACSSHGGVDCNQLDLVNDKVVCADGWKGSSVSYTEVCTPNLQSLTLHLALLSCKDFL